MQYYSSVPEEHLGKKAKKNCITKNLNVVFHSHAVKQLLNSRKGTNPTTPSFCLSLPRTSCFPQFEAETQTQDPEISFHIASKLMGVPKDLHAYYNPSAS